MKNKQLVNNGLAVAITYQPHKALAGPGATAGLCASYCCRKPPGLWLRGNKGQFFKSWF